MLKTENEITEAKCDACGKDLRSFLPRDTKCQSANYGEVKPHFGFGSDLDPMGGNIVPHYHLCEDCFAKALHAINLPVEDLDPVICPVCRKPRNGKDDHPECMKNWYPHPDSIPQKELREQMEEHQKKNREKLEK